MALRIISAEERLAESRGIKAAIFGGSGQGKTSLLWTLPADRTIFMDLEAGDLAVEGWTGDTIRPRTWQECRDFAAFIGGPNPALRDEQPYSPAHYAAACEQFGDPAKLDRYETLFVDSISVAGRLCFQWCRGQSEAFSEKSGKPDIRGAYGLHGREMIAWLTHLQHTRGKNIIFVGILDEKFDDFNRKVYVPQIDGSKTGLELPGIVDEVLTLTAIKDEHGQLRRALVCQTLNQWGYPAKDRSGRLDLIEEPHLGRLFAKIRGPARPIAERLEHSAPSIVAPEITTPTTSE
jgi:AAA domain